MIKEKNQPQEEEILKNEEAVTEESAQTEENPTEETAQEEGPAQELTVEEQLANMLAEAQQMVNEERDKYLRLSAEFDNYRKRTLKEKAELIKNGAEKTLTAILPVLDDFERAIQTMENKETDANYEGVVLIYNKFKRTLEQKGLEEINAKDAVFDTDEHEALTNVPVTDESQKGKVLDVIQKGYKLNGKVIRYARVVVGG